MSRAIYPGSFDPITLGHLNIIERALDVYDGLVILLAVNPGKKSLFTVEENLEMVHEATAKWPQVEIDSTTGLLVDYAREHGIRQAVRGLRAVTDFDAEFSMALTNRSMWEDFDTVYLMTSAEYMFLRSSTVKQIAEHGGDVSRFVPPTVEARLRARFGK
ncbi:MAG TPA: pantetheine-phosphate adenylyltransferase [Candidatus Handelsmanbacteria bacterium]|nr:pantetheine-phosphate adenylyltransferase [Candidatus Handelsmanbacteria bacterium]